MLPIMPYGQFFFDAIDYYKAIAVCAVGTSVIVSAPLMPNEA